jgi:hypothetical protein
MQPSVDRNEDCVDEWSVANALLQLNRLDKLFDVFDIFFTDRERGLW